MDSLIPDREHARNLSVFRPLGYQRNSCGYCKSKNGSASYYSLSETVHPRHYEELMNRGWRRSGKLYYKPNPQRSCCSHYTLRLDASSFQPRRDQRKAVNRWNKFILGPEYIRKAAELCPRSREEKNRRQAHFDLLSAIHETEYLNVKRPVDPKTKRPIEPAHRFEVTTESDSVSQAKFELFHKYQTKVHKDDPAKLKIKDFARFLCSGMKRAPIDPASGQKRLGSWHQCYRLDGRLIAVAVLDLVPNGVSSVYIFYDPEFEVWEIGKLSALREIALAIEDGYQYYYMGYYIHTNRKMRYKSAFRPQYILDPESFDWDPLDGELAKKLDEYPYVSLSRERRIAAREPVAPFADPDICDEEASLFDLGMPGVLTVEEVEILDLDHWLLLFHGSLVHMTDLVNWEDMSIRNPQSTKGIIAELAAVLGPNIVRESAVSLL